MAVRIVLELFPEKGKKMIILKSASIIINLALSHDPIYQDSAFWIILFNGLIVMALHEIARKKWRIYDQSSLKNVIRYSALLSPHISCLLQLSSAIKSGAWWLHPLQGFFSRLLSLVWLGARQGRRERRNALGSQIRNGAVMQALSGLVGIRDSYKAEYLAIALLRWEYQYSLHSVKEHNLQCSLVFVFHMVHWGQFYNSF